MASAVYKIINPLMKGILKSPMHGMMSKDIATLEFTGRKSGRQMSTPVTYLVKDGRIHCFTSKESTWWKNLVDAPEMAMVLARERFVGQPQVITDDYSTMQAALTDFLTAIPRDASFSNIGLDENKVPIAADVEKAVPGMVYVSMPHQAA